MDPITVETIPDKSRKTKLKNFETIFHHCIKCETDCCFKKAAQYALEIGVDQFLMQQENYRLPIDIVVALMPMQKAMICSITSSYPQ